MLAHIKKKFDTVIFGQLSLEKPNVGKSVQQMRVYILIFSSEIFTRKVWQK